MFSTVISAAIHGIESRVISVEADVSNGLPGFAMVGYLASEVREAQERVRTALRNSGYQMRPQRITVNLAPADIRKSGTGFDVPIAVALMAAYGLLPQEALGGILFAGELGLDGRIQGIRGVLGMVLEAREAGCHSCVIPKENVREGAAIQGIQVYGVGHLRELVDQLTSEKKKEPAHINIEEMFPGPAGAGDPDFSDIKGQRGVKRAAEIAAAGMHNLLISGPPGSGKSMIAKRIPSILPPLSMEEALEVTRIHSIAGTLPGDGIMTRRPFRMPHHTASAVALTGGGFNPHPGEISLAHRGVLYLDELPEFPSDTLETLRQPLEDGEIRVSRISGSYVFPAKFMLVASRNPCKCGYYPDRQRCRCGENSIRKYLGRISRPLLDRIDLHVESRRMEYSDLVERQREESSREIRERVEAAREIQGRRYRDSGFHFNSELTPAELPRYCGLGTRQEKLIRGIYEQKHLTARSYHRMLKVARTIADLEGCEEIETRHLSEAVLYRPSELFW